MVVPFRTDTAAGARECQARDRVAGTLMRSTKWLKDTIGPAVSLRKYRTIVSYIPNCTEETHSLYGISKVTGTVHKITVRVFDKCDLFGRFIETGHVTVFSTTSVTRLSAQSLLSRPAA